MIYLFEDRKGRMDKLLNNSLNSEIINTETQILVSKSELDSFFNSLINVQALLIHKSYKFPAKDITIEDIKTICKNKGIPIGIFSGGESNAIIDENFVMCNSGDFYNNLNLFLDEYQNRSTINLPLLVFGKRYILNELKQLQIKVSIKTFQKKDIDILSLKLIRNDVENYLSAPEIEDDKNKLIKSIESNIVENKAIKSEIILSQIKKLIDKYANN
jgi:hypothetical protein